MRSSSVQSARRGVAGQRTPWASDEALCARRDGPHVRRGDRALDAAARKMRLLATITEPPVVRGPARGHACQLRGHRHQHRGGGQEQRDDLEDGRAGPRVLRHDLLRRRLAGLVLEHAA
jgi:hypothetical protein